MINKLIIIFVRLSCAIFSCIISYAWSRPLRPPRLISEGVEVLVVPVLGEVQPSVVAKQLPGAAYFYLAVFPEVAFEAVLLAVSKRLYDVRVDLLGGGLVALK